MAWKIGVEVPEELADREPSVLQRHGEEVEEDPVNELRWPLVDPLGSAAVQWSDESGAANRRDFEASEYRVFKIATAGDRGRAVSRLTRGHYIVIAPRALIRDEVTSGPPPVAPENVAPEEAAVVAHHFLADPDSGRLVLGGDDGSSVEITPSSVAAYELVGHQIEDAHPTAGPLFGREPPLLAMGESAEPAQVVVGVEGPSPRGRPRQTAANFEEVRNWFSEHQPGWFFVRLYDGNGDLLDSLDFRYAEGLKEIEIEEHSPLPGPEGHHSVAVRFRLARLKVSLVDGLKEITSLRSLPAKGFVWPAHPDARQATLCLHGERGGEVEVVVQVRRVWWALITKGEQDETPAWTDKPLNLSTEYFQPTSSRQLSVLLPAPSWADRLLVGFRESPPRRVPVLRTEGRVDYPLRNLGEEHALRRGGRCDLLVSVESGATRHGPVTVGEIRPRRDESREYEELGSLDLAVLSAPKLMSVITHMARSMSAPERRAFRFLREIYYRPSRRGGQAEKKEFVVQGLSLVAALLERGISPRVPRCWRRRTELLAELKPTTVASWQLRLRRAENSMRWKDLVGTEGRRG